MKILEIDNEFIIADKIVSFRIRQNPNGSSIDLNLLGDGCLTVCVSENLKTAKEKLIWVLSQHSGDYFRW